MCKGIVSAQQQAAKTFGDQKTYLDQSQLQECNRALQGVRLTAGFVAPVASLVINSEPEPGSPGPNGNVENLLNQFGDRINDADRDFMMSVGWSPDIWQDGEDPNVWYYLPVEYRLQLLNSGDRPLALGFVHTYETESQGDKTVLMTATFSPPATNGDLALLEALANSAIQDNTGKSITLRPFPVDTVEIQLADELAGFGILPEDIRVTETPRNVREPISMRIRMDEVAQTTLLSLMREPGGIGGQAVIRFGDSYSVSIPLYISFRKVSGYPMPTMNSIKDTRILSNASFLPVTLNGIVGYVKLANATLVRKYRPMTNRPTLAPNAQQTVPASVAIGFADAFGSAEVVHTWFDYDSDEDCSQCLANVERMAESQVGLTRRDQLTIEIPDFVFGDRAIFKVTVQVRSKAFDSSGTVEEVRDFQLRSGNGVVSEDLFLDRSRSADAGIGEYRFMAIFESGNKGDWTNWKTLESTDLTLVSTDFETNE